MNKHFYDNFLLVSQCDKARPYLMRLYIIFPIHLSFPIRSRCVLKATVSFIEKNSGLFYSYLSKFFFFKKTLFVNRTCMWYMMNFSISSRFVPIFHVSLSIIYLLLLPHHVLYMQFFLNIFKGFSL